MRSAPSMRIIVHRSGEFAIPVTAIRRISATSETLPLYFSGLARYSLVSLAKPTSGAIALTFANQALLSSEISYDLIKLLITVFTVSLSNLKEYSGLKVSSKK